MDLTIQRGGVYFIQKNTVSLIPLLKDDSMVNRYVTIFLYDTL